MKNGKLLLFIWALLAAFFLIALSSIIQSAPKLVGKSYVDTEEFKQEMDEFYYKIGPAVLNPLDPEEATKKISVSRNEIDEHRNWYGSLPDQIANIHDQYEGRIVEARESGNKELEDTFIKDRNTKITDIQKNFESDVHVEAKIRAEKAAIISQYVGNIKGSEVGYFPIAYKFTDAETGETFSSGNIDVPAAYKKTFNSASELFKASSIPGNDFNSEWFHRTGEGVSGFNSNEGLNEIKNPVRTFEGVVVVPKTALKAGTLSMQVANYNKHKYMTYLLWLLGALSAVALFTVIKFNKEWVTETSLAARYDKLKIDLKVGLLLLSLICTVEIIYYRSTSNFSHYHNYSGIWTDRIGWLIVLALAIAFIAFQLVISVERWKHKGVLEQDMLNSYTVKIVAAFREMFLKKTIGAQMFFLLIGFFLAGIGFVIMFFHPFNVIIYAMCVLFFGLPILYIFSRRSAYLNRIIIATEAMSHGRLHEAIRVEGKSPLAQHAMNLNNLREGVRSSMTEQAKSERLKTELITNVSHDLRTPLTSIITYTDLLKNEDLPAEERAKYVDILDKKSQRLKTLIEDLFEVSKMASGNMELNKQRIDLAQLLQQALAEHEETITETGLDFRMTLPDTALLAFVDGKRWWRVLDNLIVNAVKYTLPGTRVYITLRKLGETAEFIVKNVTKYELGENTDELFERFKRADTSRQTDGSGLGLAIAQSIVDMHGGNMKIEVDGDLFKVTVSVPIIY